MIIKDITVSRNKDSVTLSADCKIRKIGWDNIYITLEGKKHHDFIFEDASPFAAALLLPSMRVGEDLIIHGSISEQLFTGMQAVVEEVLTWGIGLQRIQIKPDAVTPDSQQPSRTGTFFSGGVDSFYTFLKHKKDRTKSHLIDSFIFVNNSFDIDQRNKKLWDQTLKNIRAIAKEENIELFVIKSNINTHELLAPIVSWDYIHGACLAASALALRNGFGRIYVPSTHSEAEQIPWGSNLALDSNWSTEKISFRHDGSEVTRLEKVVLQVSKSPTALRHLRVCYKNIDGVYNCGHCDKCLRTMVNLYIAGALDKAKTFPNELDLDLIARTPTIQPPIFHTENLQALKKKHLNPELQEAIATSLRNTQELEEETRSQKTAKQLIFLDHTYMHGRLYALASTLLGRKFAD